MNFELSYKTGTRTASSLTADQIDTEATLLAAAREMNQDALIKIFDLYSSRLYGYALRLCRDPNEADNIVGDVFAKLLDQLADGNGPKHNLRSYLYQMTYHLVLDNVRISNREAPLELVEFMQGSKGNIPANLESRVLLDALVLAIKNDLTEDQRHVIILRFIEGFNLLETAEIIGRDVQNVKVIQNRGIAKLRRILDHKVSE